jgi:hypothetical protein
MFAEDISAYFDTATGFAQACTVNGVSVDAIFDNGYSTGSVGALGMANTEPTLTLATALVPASPTGLPVVANGTNYLVALHEPDGTGISRLVLELAA